ncbi:MAG: hypothetical protein PHW13_11030 [Methylococcales bacterium]|nr:hypothetical protein [Methylococcales bacterium]
MFQYTVAASQNTAALQISSINTNGAKILDSKGNTVFSSDAVSSTDTLSVKTVIVAPLVVFSADVGSMANVIGNNSQVMVTLAASAENVNGDNISSVAIYANGSFIANPIANGDGVWTYTGNALPGQQSACRRYYHHSRCIERCRYAS